MPNETTRTVLVAIRADLGIALAKVFAAVFTGSTAVAAAAADSLADTANEVFPCWLSGAAVAGPTVTMPWGTGGTPTSGHCSRPSACSPPGRCSPCARASRS
jgi:divalent metal cation (Fe/Co/Zn/Cd) transporter